MSYTTFQILTSLVLSLLVAAVWYVIQIVLDKMPPRWRLRSSLVILGILFCITWFVFSMVVPDPVVALKDMYNEQMAKCQKVERWRIQVETKYPNHEIIYDMDRYRVACQAMDIHFDLANELPESFQVIRSSISESDILLARIDHEWQLLQDSLTTP